MDKGQVGELVSGLQQDGTFGAVAAAHELKAPVALMRHLALELESDPSLSPNQAQILQQIIMSAERSLRLTTNLTRSARLENSSLFYSEPVNAQQLCEEVAHELTPLYKAHDRDIIVQSRRRSPLVVANRELLRSILLNFGDNALHYAGNHKATFSVWETAGSVKVGLRDYGVVSPKKQSAAIIGRPHSSGLGLRIAQEFAKAMRSNVGVTRHRDGMTFYVRMLASEQLSLL